MRVHTCSSTMSFVGIFQQGLHKSVYQLVERVQIFFIVL